MWLSRLRTDWRFNSGDNYFGDFNLLQERLENNFCNCLRLFLSSGMADSDQRREFLEEIQLMKALGSHKNIVNMVGCCTLEEPMFLLVEFVPYGDLLHYLRKRRGKVQDIN